jgi:hypothetical protein
MGNPEHERRNVMLKNRNIFLLVSGLAVILGVCGCGQKRIEGTEVPGQPGANEMAQAPKSVPGHYLVERHDCLWTIAGQPKIYGDSFQWPELFKANRDQIQDPDLIYPKQVLKVEKDFSAEEINHARQMASLTPKYVPHSKPRQALPLDYF